ncbi:MAG: hypothetical protein ACE5NP_11955 [Anaerolineae bacterium]
MLGFALLQELWYNLARWKPRTAQLWVLSRVTIMLSHIFKNRKSWNQLGGKTALGFTLVSITAMIAILGCGLGDLLAGARPTPTPTKTPRPTHTATPEFTSTPTDTSTPTPTDTPEATPTFTPAPPTPTPKPKPPTATPTPSQPTATPTPAFPLRAVVNDPGSPGDLAHCGPEIRGRVLLKDGSPAPGEAIGIYVEIVGWNWSKEIAAPQRYSTDGHWDFMLPPPSGSADYNWRLRAQHPTVGIPLSDWVTGTVTAECGTAGAKRWFDIDFIQN